MSFMPILQEKHKKNIEKFYFDACEKHKTPVLSLQIDSGFHQLDEYLSIFTEKGDSFYAVGDEEPVIRFNTTTTRRTYEFVVENKTILSYVLHVEQLDDGKFSHGDKTYNSEEELLKSLESGVLNDVYYSDIVDDSMEILESKWIK